MLRINYPYPDVRPNIDPRSVERLRQKGGLRVSFALGYYDGKSGYWVLVCGGCPVFPEVG